MTDSKRISVEEKNLVNGVTSALKRNVGNSVHNTVRLDFFR